MVGCSIPSSMTYCDLVKIMIMYVIMSFWLIVCFQKLV
jgi:hypothetical protein